MSLFGLDSRTTTREQEDGLLSENTRGWIPAAMVAAIVGLPAAAVAQTPPAAAMAQTLPAPIWQREVSAGLGVGHVFRFDDRTFGRRPNIAAGVALIHRSGLGFELELNRTLTMSPQEAPCGILIDGEPATCVGRAHEGVRAVTIGALNAHYRFTWRGLHPYLTAGVGVLHSRSVWSTATVKDGQVFLTEQNLTDVGVGPNVGIGIRFEPAPNVSIGPDVRWLEAAARSRLNLAATRFALRGTYAW